MATYPAGSMLHTSGLSKTYPSGDGQLIRACDEVEIDVARGEFVAVTGPSGSGKSTLLYLIGALLTPDAGEIYIDGRNITAMRSRDLAAYRRTVGFVFQQFHLIPTLNAIDNVLAPLVPYSVSFDRYARARELLEVVGLDGRGRHLPGALSGGQQQRVAIARALINSPGLILADEPTGNLDSSSGEQIMDLLLDLREQRGATVLMATHDERLAARCDRELRVLDGQVQRRET